MMGLVAQINREENQTKEAKGSPYIGDNRERKSPTQLHLKAPKNKKRGAEAPPTPSSLLTMAGNKASPPNYAHKYQNVKKGESNFPVLSYLIYKFTTCVRAKFFPLTPDGQHVLRVASSDWLLTPDGQHVLRVASSDWLQCPSVRDGARVSGRPSRALVFRTWFSGLGISTLGPGFSHSRFPRPKPENF